MKSFATQTKNLAILAQIKEPTFLAMCNSPLLALIYLMVRIFSRNYVLALEKSLCRVYMNVYVYTNSFI